MTSSAAQFIVFREKRKTVTREILCEKSLTKNRRKKVVKKRPNGPYSTEKLKKNNHFYRLFET